MANSPHLMTTLEIWEEMKNRSLKMDKRIFQRLLVNLRTGGRIEGIKDANSRKYLYETSCLNYIEKEIRERNLHRDKEYFKQNNYITTKEAAEILELNTSYINGLCRKGLLDALFYIDRYMIATSAIEEYREKHKVKVQQGFFSKEDILKTLDTKGLAMDVDKFYRLLSSFRKQRKISGIKLTVSGDYYYDSNTVEFIENEIKSRNLHLNEEYFKQNNFLTTDEVAQILGKKRHHVTKLIREGHIKNAQLYKINYMIPKESIVEYQTQYSDTYDSLFSSSQILEQLNSEGFELDKQKFKHFLLHLRKKGEIKAVEHNIYKGYFYDKENVEFIKSRVKITNLHMDENSFTEEGYLSTNEAAKRLNLSMVQINEKCKKGKFKDVIKYKNQYKIPITSIEEFLKENDTSDFISPADLAKELGVGKHFILRRIRTKEIKAEKKDGKWYIPLYEASAYQETYNLKTSEYTKDLALKNMEDFFRTTTRIPLDSHELYVSWANDKIVTSQGRPRTLHDIFLNAKNLYESLKGILTNKEIYELSESELGIIVEKDIYQKRLKKEFVSYYNFSLAKKGIVKEITLKDDRSGANKNKAKDEKEIYKPEIFQEYYTYVQDIELHTNKAIKSRYYANMWIFVIMHLTNIWRANDIIYEMPSVDIELIGVNSFDFFKDGRLSTAQAQTIVNDVYLKLENLIAHKNKELLRFYLDPELLKCFATSMVISELHRRKFAHTQNHKALLLSTFLSGYRGQYIATSGREHHMKFFNNNENLLNFKSLVMNRATSVYIFHHILEEDGEESSLALDMTGRARSHKKKETTAIYVEATNSDGSINRVSLNLFNRGHFGWMYNYLIKFTLKSQEQHSLEDRTNLISRSKDSLSPLSLEKWSKFLLDQSRSRESIEIRLSKLPEEELLHLLYKIYNLEMPSKEKEGQCLIYPKCIYKKRKTCFGCEYFIPQQMILLKIANELRSRIEILSEQSEFDAIRIRESRFIWNLLLFLNESVEYLGKEKVETFITTKEISTLINSIEDYLITPEEQLQLNS